MSRPTLSELRWPIDEQSQRQAAEWASEIANQALDWTWRAFDVLKENILSKVDINQPFEQLERDFTRNHFAEIQKLWARETGGESSIEPQAEYPEMESRAPAPAKPPAYDIAFVWSSNRRVAMPFEAKVVPTVNSLAAYLGDTDKFKNGIAAPLVGDGAQIAYLLLGETDSFWGNLCESIEFAVLAAKEPVVRSQKVSIHSRAKAPKLKLYHLVMYCGKE
jgi:hypothetical protein